MIFVMKNTFRQAFIAAVAEADISVKKVAEAAGVSYEQLKKLNQGKSASTNVDDAQKIAEVFQALPIRPQSGFFPARQESPDQPVRGLAGQLRIDGNQV